MYKVIIFDLDGTLYDLNDVIASVYKIQVDFLSDYFRKTKSEIQDFFSGNQIYPYKSSNSASATELFEKIGINPQVWKSYREAHFDLSAISLKYAVSESLLVRFSKYADLVLLSSNTYQTILKILKKLKINPALFCSIISSDHRSSIGSFNKTNELKTIVNRHCLSGKDILSIGDRFKTDIQPALAVGGDGVLVNGPSAVETVYTDFSENNLQTRAGIYQFFCEENSQQELVYEGR